MIIAGSLLLGSLLLAWAAPAGLRRISIGRVDPVTAMCWWLVCLAAVLATFAVGTGLLLLPGDHPSGVLADLAAGCWAALRHGRLPELDEVLGAVGLVALMVVAGRFGYAATAGLHSRRRAHRAHLAYLGALGAADSAGPAPTVWIEHAAPLAYSLAGRPGLVVATTGLRRLPVEQSRAVLCHERAHLRGRHHLVTLLIGALAHAFPVSPLFRHAPAAIGVLAELAADAAAVRACGPHAVRAALLAIDRGGAPEPALAMGDEAVKLRLRHVAQPRPQPHAAVRAVSRVASGLALAALPGLLGFGVFAVAAALSCTG